jgi:hypothetical protein
MVKPGNVGWLADARFWIFASTPERARGGTASRSNDARRLELLEPTNRKHRAVLLRAAKDTIGTQK